jgi:hypothetical protein
MRFRLLSRPARLSGALLVALALAGTGVLSQQSQSSEFKLTPEIQAALDRVSENSLRGHLSFIASDLLEGRATPSRGQDIAAEYIAAQFRRAGLEPVGDADEQGAKTYFQNANWAVLEGDPAAFEMTLSGVGQSLSVNPAQVSFAGDQGIEVQSAALFKLDYKDAKALAALKAEQVAGKAVMVEIPDFRREPREKWAELSAKQNDFVRQVRALNPALLVTLDRGATTSRGLGSKRLLDPERRGAAGSGVGQPLQVHDPRVLKLFDGLKTGETGMTLNVRVPASVEKPVKLRNVIGLLRGSDPVLKDSYVMVTAHYDHLGTGAQRCAPVGNDSICNGANDDGSGTVSVVELASALATLKQRPKRSIIFMTVFGEESGLLGSRYYGRHPIFPIEKTVADVNLEHVGRTDDVEGDKTNTATLTGFDFTDVGPIFQKAGELTGIKVYKHEQNSDSFFGRSDNQALADQGVPAHTLCVAFIFPDYHQAGDHWEKVNYPNLAKTNRMVMLALLMLADSTTAPKWNEANPKTAKYVQAWKARRGN